MEPELDSDLLATTTPGVEDLAAEFRQCSPDAGTWDRAADAERVRFAIWDHQTPDCRKNSDGDFEAKPWEGASDLREFLADDIIGEQVATCIAAFHRAMLKAEGVQVDDAAAASVVTRLVTWMVKNRLADELEREVELSAQTMLTYGWVGLHVTWLREISTRTQEFSMDQLVSVAPELGELIMDTANEDVALRMLVGSWEAIASVAARDTGVAGVPPVPKKRLRTALRELRETGVTRIPVPFVSKSQPNIRVLLPWQDIFVPDELGDVQKGRTYVRQFYREEELRSKVLTDGWDDAWVELVVATKGQASVWNSETVAIDPANPTMYQADKQPGNPFIEVVTAYSRRIDDSGCPGIYVTVFSPHVTKDQEGVEVFAMHGLIDYQHGEVPVVVGVREWVRRSISSSRGIPELAAPDQRVIKVQSDALIDRTSLTTLPPRLIPARLMDDDTEFGPAAKLPITQGLEPKFMPIPARDGVAEEIIAQRMRLTGMRFGRIMAEVPATLTQLHQQRLVNKFLSMWSSAFRQATQLILQYMGETEWQRVTDVPKPSMDALEIRGLFDLLLSIDVRDLDTDFALKQLEAISKFILPEDAAGVIDRAKLVQAKLQAVNPVLARQLVSDSAGAQQKIFRDVSASIASMFLGNPPELVENDPTAPMQLQFAQQIVASNPNYQQALQAGGRFSEMLKVWAKNRTQSQVQQQNKVVGRLGVQPVAQGQ